MFTFVENSTRRTVSAMAAVAIVSLSGLVMDQAHLAAAPRGTVEVGELTLVNEAQIAAVTLPEVTVVAKRFSQGNARFAATAELPEIVVVAKRVATLVAQSAAVTEPGKSVNSAAEGALLK
jgi:hypothetical protein